ncbi:PIG-X [Boletus coccyginus]|nr:PIG-X [Boletus coccyginus]
MSSTVISHSLEPHRGFHSTLSTVFALDPPDPDCSFFVLYTFPQTIIIDRYELTGRRLSFEFWGESNLELPVFALNRTPNSLLLINATPADVRPKQIAVDVPVHARYGEPGTAPTSSQSITISAPSCFWACPLSGAYAVQNATSTR